MYVGDRDTYNDVFCQYCGEIADRSTLDDNGLCEECAAIFCPVCNQEHNADDAGYCQSCKEPVIDVTTGKFFENSQPLPKGDTLLFCEKCGQRTQHTQTELNGDFFLYACCVCPC